MLKRLSVAVLGLSCSLATVSSLARTRTSQALLVVGSARLGAGDRAIQQRLERLGYGVTVRPAARLVPRDADGKALVLISATAEPEAVRRRAAATAGLVAGAPVITWNAPLFADLGMTGPASGVDFGTAPPSAEVAVARPDHPMAAGLGSRVSVTTSPTAMSWARPAPGAVWIAACAEDAGRATAFGFEAGTRVNGAERPARRVGLFLGPEAAGALTRQGWALFDAAVAWAAAHNQAPRVDAGPDRQALSGGPAVMLRGVVQDDGRPEGRALAVRWTVVAGDGPVTIGDDTAAVTSLRLWKPGEYLLELSAFDGRHRTSDQVRVVVLAPREAAAEPVAEAAAPSSP